MHPQLARWIEWLAIIKNEVQLLLIARDIFWSVQRMIEANRRIQMASSFYSFLGNSYVANAAMSVRRQLKVDAKSISLARLLTEIIQNPQILDRQYYKSLYAGSNVEDMADCNFDGLVGEGRGHIDPEMVDAELNALRADGLACEELADRRIAHWDIRGVSRLPTFNELDSCIDHLDRLCIRYLSIMHAHVYESLMPTYQYDWREIFRHPWLPPNPVEGDREI